MRAPIADGSLWILARLSSVSSNVFSQADARKWKPIQLGRCKRSKYLTFSEHAFDSAILNTKVIQTGQLDPSQSLSFDQWAWHLLNLASTGSRRYH